MNNLEDIEERVKIEIKEKIKNNPKYLHPCNKDRLEDMKRLGFSSGYEFTVWIQNNGILKNPADVLREYREGLAKRSGFKNNTELNKEWRHRTGRFLPYDINEECPLWFGIFTEDLMIHYYPGAIRMPPKNPGFDYILTKEGKEIKIDNKGRCLTYRHEGNPNWKYGILWNNKADKFILSGWDNRESLNPLYAWEFDKNDMVRGKPFWERDSFTITFTPEGLEQFENCRIDIGWLDEKVKLKKLSELKEEHINY